LGGRKGIRPVKTEWWGAREVRGGKINGEGRGWREFVLCPRKKKEKVDACGLS